MTRRGTLLGPPSERKRRLAQYAPAIQGSRRRRTILLAVAAAMLALLVFGIVQLEFSFGRLGRGLDQLATLFGLMVPPSPGTRLPSYLHALAETLAIAFLGTLLAATLAFPLGFLAAKNVLPSWIFHFSIRRFLDTVRGVDTLIWALIWINVVGLGPFAGVLAIASSDLGAFGKLFSEAIEATDRKPVEGLRSTGANALEEVRFAILPQVLPVIAAQILYYFESNTRSATIIGIVGAGGIGLYLSEEIRSLEWSHVAFLVLMILGTVAVIDVISSRLRFAIIGSTPVQA